MSHDPLRSKITDRLGEDLDPYLFETCAVDLLRSDWPVVPIPGGNDAGMDGAVADSAGHPFPLVTTTSADVIGNLTRNLQSYLQSGGERRKVIVATSEALSPKQRRNLRDRAKELGFTLIQIYSQSGIANLLYHNPEWSQDLLGVSGDPAPLSAVPKGSRPLLDQPLVGREEDLGWLQNQEGDRLLVGQPGSGKSFLLYQLTDASALFAATQNRGDLADGIRGQSPKAVIVDDASTEVGLLEELLDLRRQIAAEFDIIASCWPGDADEIRQALHIGGKQTRELRPLTRDEIVEVVRDAGIEGPRGLIRQIVDQANGRPGLAVTLAHHSLQGNVREVLFGDRIAEGVLVTYRSVAGDTAKEILAILSVGDDAGLTVESVAELLDRSLIDVRQTLQQLAAGGVLTEVQRSTDTHKHLVVEPPALRHALIRDVFFEGTASLPISLLRKTLQEVPATASAVEALIGAYARGASMSPGFLRSMIGDVNRRKTWQMFASVGREEAQWILTKHPEKVEVISKQALAHAPSEALPLLFEAMKEDPALDPPSRDDPLSEIKEWVLSGRPGTEEAIGRRRILFQSAKEWLDDGRDRGVGLYALRYALSPQFEDSYSDPGSGRQITMERGVLLQEEIEEIRPLWEDIWDLLEEERLEEWLPILDLLHDWLHPEWHWDDIPNELRLKVRGFGQEEARTATELAASHPGILRRLHPIAANAGFEIDTSDFEAFGALYPEQRPDDRQSRRQQELSRIEKLAESWSERTPVQVAQDLAEIYRQTEYANLHITHTRALCQHLADSVENALSYYQAFLEAELSPQLTRPFLLKAAEVKQDGWVGAVREQLAGDSSPRGPALMIALSSTDTPCDLRELALSQIEGREHLAKTLLMRDELNEETIRDLLKHESDRVASATAEVLWQSEALDSPTMETAPESVRKLWREVVADRVDDGHWLAKAFEHDVELARRWVKNQIRTRSEFDHLNFSHRGTEEEAIDMLPRSSRKSLLNTLCGMDEDIRPLAYNWARLLVGDDLDLYQHLLNQAVETDLHLSVLIGKPDGDLWTKKAKLAADAGYTPEQIARASASIRGISGVKWGPWSEVWEEWFEAFSNLTSEDPRVERAIEIGRKIAARQADQAEERERRERM